MLFRIILLGSTVTLVGCGTPTTTSKYVPPHIPIVLPVEAQQDNETGTRLREGVTKLQTESAAFQAASEQATQRFRSALKDGPTPSGATLNQMAVAWGQDVSAMDAAHKQMAAALKDVCAHETKLWARVTEYNGRMTDAKMKDRSKAANEKRRAEWVKALETATERVAHAGTVVRVGADVCLELKSAALRGYLAECTDILNSIDTDAKTIMKDIAILTEHVNLLEGLVPPPK